MEVKKSTIKNVLIGVIVVGVAILFLHGLGGSKSTLSDDTAANSVTTSGDTQIIDLTAKGGYTPTLITAKSGIKTTLRVTTSNTFDCSSSIRIPSLNISKPLPASGTTDIDLGTQAAGTIINITCSMGMYSSKISFS